jgi:hypothetical protein
MTNTNLGPVAEVRSREELQEELRGCEARLDALAEESLALRVRVDALRQEVRQLDDAP